MNVAELIEFLKQFPPNTPVEYKESTYWVAAKEVKPEIVDGVLKL